MRIILYILAAFGLLFIAQLLFGYYLMHTLPGPSDFGGESDGSSIRSFNIGPNFNKYVYLSPPRGFDPFSRKAKPPGGNAKVSGRFVFNGAPVEGLKLKLHINDYASKELVTDADGEFSLDIQSGDNVFSLLEVERWPSKPQEGEYLVVSKYDQRLDQVLNRTWPETGEPINIAAGQDYHLGEFTIAKHLSFTNPADKKISVMENPAAQTLSWNQHPSAETYVLNIQRVKRRGNGSTSSSVFRKVTNSTAFKMEGITFLPNENEKTLEYSLDLKAYNANGELVSETGFNAAGFKLSGLEIADPRDISISQSTAETLMGEFKTVEQIDAVRVLVDEEMFSSAQQLLTKVNDVYSDWRLDRVQGYLAAKQGKCDEARKHFSQAELKAGFKCVADKFWAACEG